MTAAGGPVAAVRTVRTRAERLLAVCGKCSRKFGGGFGKGGNASLTKVLRRGLADARGKRAVVRVVETHCMGLCPRHAVAMIDGNRPGAFLVVAEGTDLGAIASRLELPLA